MNHINLKDRDYKDFEETLVSIIVITFNSEKYIAETLESIKEQTYNTIELIISDDHSNDETIEICESWLKENSDRFVRTQIVLSETNTGIAHNCNRGILASRGEWIKVIAGDDALEPDMTRRYMQFAKLQSNAVAIFSRIEAYEETFEPEKKIRIKSNANKGFNCPQSTAKEQFNVL
ncbi:MAG TPA: glycosyltransferase family A protein, partial [Flavisolibacter sp.]|nr:glycosyltransferase family A protein [Flavisolibacter sp.]